MLLLLSTENIRALSLKNHLVLTTVRGDLDQVSCLMRVVYLAFWTAQSTLNTADPHAAARSKASGLRPSR
ncbi:hypothetical protein bgla_1g14660 [Burkholderia gladioli BSR3]|uniref:Uncharacterized protein n=1 Tax=Burkholderia gladioli (strain BSR3) TaxID=999541 RepID=F2LB67_BURGS|nr:hypothetical protein bgla_1g14660 [Burkholderia gladioli BSR3]